MRQILLSVFMMAAVSSFAQKLDIITVDKRKIAATLLDSTARSNMLAQFNGRQDNSIRKKWTARTYQLSDGRVLIEFYDKQAVLVDNLEQFRSLDRVRFVKNTIDFLKKDISYKIELTFDEGKQIIEKEKPVRLTRYKSDLPQWYDFEVYQLSTGQILFLDKSENFQAAAIFPDIKTLASEKTSVLEEEYGSEDDEHLMKRLSSGDRLSDYEVHYHLIYPKYLKDLVKNHKLTLVEQKVYVAQFFGNLYRAEDGYYVLVDDVNQKNGAGKKMQIASLRMYDSLEQVREDQRKWIAFKERGFTSEHFYQKLSDEFGERYPEYVSQLANKFPGVLNFDKEQLSFDSTGMDLVDEALKWNGTNYKLFDSWFPSVLAYYGQCFINQKQEGQWISTFDKEYKIWIPELKLSDGTTAWDWRDFYKDLCEGPIPMRWAGDWDGLRKNMRSEK